MRMTLTRRRFPAKDVLSGKTVSATRICYFLCRGFFRGRGFIISNLPSLQIALGKPFSASGTVQSFDEVSVKSLKLCYFHIYSDQRTSIEETWLGALATFESQVVFNCCET
jgi:hypothetical protein